MRPRQTISRCKGLMQDENTGAAKREQGAQSDDQPRKEDWMNSMSRLLMGTVLAGTLAAAAPATWASSHREAPAISGMPRVDSTDFYMFRSFSPARIAEPGAGYVTLIANYVPLQAPYGGPNYFALDNDAIYEIHIDNNGDAQEDLTFQFNFDSALDAAGTRRNAGIELSIGGQNVAIPLRQAGGIGPGIDGGALNELETYTVTLIRGDRRTGRRSVLSPTTAPIAGSPSVFVKPVDNIGMKTIPDYAAYANQHIYTVNVPTCGRPARIFAGQRAENFAVNLGEIFDLVNIVPIQGADSANWPQYNVPAGAQFPGGITQSRENDDVVDEFNVTSLAVEMPVECLTAAAPGATGFDPVIGGWTSASLPQARLLDPTPNYNATSRSGGAFVQVSRLSNPLVNEVVIGLRDKDRFSESEPSQDLRPADGIATYVTNPTLPALLNILFRDAVNTTLGANIPDLAPTNFPRNDLVAAFATGFPGFNQPANLRSGGEMMRLNTAVPPTPVASQNVFGVVAEDLAGFPNGRRPTDDTVDIALRVVMGALCHPLPLGAELGVAGAVEDTATDLVNLGLCTPEQAVVGTVPFTDGAPLRPADVLADFPYLNAPIPGSPNN
jgi:hypothetical protein